VVLGTPWELAEAIRAAYNGLVDTDPATDFHLRVTSGWRNPERNEAVGGAHGSPHQFGNGVDLVFSPVPPGFTKEQAFCLIADAAWSVPGVVQVIPERFGTNAQLDCDDELVNHIHVKSE
jgi:hypothetical protein